MDAHEGNGAYQMEPFQNDVLDWDRSHWTHNITLVMDVFDEVTWAIRHAWTFTAEVRRRVARSLPRRRRIHCINSCRDRRWCTREVPGRLVIVSTPSSWLYAQHYAD